METTVTINQTATIAEATATNATVAATGIIVEQCALFGWFGWAVQASLGIIAVTVLLIKHFLPSEKRNKKVFLMDFFKQQMAMLSAHMMNLFIASYIVMKTGTGDGCVWYMMNYLTDVLVGATMYLSFMWLLNKYAFP